MWSNGRTQTVCHSYTTRNYRNHSKVQYGRRDTTRISSLYLQTFRMCEKSVLDPIPRTQYRPICVTVNPIIVSQPTTSRRRFNLKKALTSTRQYIIGLQKPYKENRDDHIAEFLLFGDITNQNIISRNRDDLQKLWQHRNSIILHKR